jgi:hypothetical protein
MPARPGNNRLDTLKNLIEQPGVGLMFLIPGSKTSCASMAPRASRATPSSWPASSSEARHRSRCWSSRSGRRSFTAARRFAVHGCGIRPRASIAARIERRSRLARSAVARGRTSGHRRGTGIIGAQDALLSTSRRGVRAGMSLLLQIDRGEWRPRRHHTGSCVIVTSARLGGLATTLACLCLPSPPADQTRRLYGYRSVYERVVLDV